MVKEKLRVCSWCGELKECELVNGDWVCKDCLKVLTENVNWVEELGFGGEEHE
jgi:predicted Fe-S protein YdhL (DUF1289 family)